MGSGAIKSNPQEEENIYDYEDIKLKDGVYYVTIPRERYKMPFTVLTAFAKRNNFSKEKEYDDSNLTQSKKKRAGNHKNTKL